MKVFLLLTLLLGVTLAAPRPTQVDSNTDGAPSLESPDTSTDGETGEATADSEVSAESSNTNSGDELEQLDSLERGAVFGHYAHVYGAGKEGQDRKEEDEADQAAAAAAEEQAKSWPFAPGFPPQGGFPPGSFPGPNQGGPPPNPSQGGPFRPRPSSNSNQGNQGPFHPNPNRSPGPFQKNQQNFGAPPPGWTQDQHAPQGFPSPPPGWPQDQKASQGFPAPQPGWPQDQQAPQGFPARPPWWPEDMPFPPPMEGTPGSDRHMIPPPPPDQGMFEDMDFMNDPRGSMPAGFPPMLDEKSGFPPMMGPSEGEFAAMMGPPSGYPPFFPQPPPQCPNVCDLTAYPDCTCLHPAAFTKDGRGNCNVGSLKPDLQVWCYVNPDKGDPRSVCPDAKKSTTKKGYYWSRFACITE